MLERNNISRRKPPASLEISHLRHFITFLCALYCSGSELFGSGIFRFPRNLNRRRFTRSRPTRNRGAHYLDGAESGRRCWPKIIGLSVRPKRPFISVSIIIFSFLLYFGMNLMNSKAVKPFSCESYAYDNSADFHRASACRIWHCIVNMGLEQIKRKIGRNQNAIHVLANGTISLMFITIFISLVLMSNRRIDESLTNDRNGHCVATRSRFAQIKTTK